MLIEKICDSNICVGCGNCKNSCPVGAISMSSNAEGFLIPSVDYTLCINCGKCANNCPLIGLKYKAVDSMPDCFIVRAKDVSITKTSASGGVCTLIARHFIEKLGGFVCGAVYGNEFDVHHIVSNCISDVDRMQQSKYVQSDLRECFIKVKDLLESGNHVLMTGTGCQIYALRKFLGRDYDRLFCIDVICHGTPSPKVQKEYINWLEKKYGKIENINNRNKKMYPHSYVSTYAASFANGKNVVKRYSDDPMADAFFQHLSIRMSCHDCRFKTVHRLSDLTIGDFWFSEMFGFGEDKYGVNLCLVQSKKGQALLEQLSQLIEYKAIDSETAIILNGGMIYSSSKANKNRQIFFEKLGCEPFDSLVFKYDGISRKVKIKNYLRELLAPFLRKTTYYNKRLPKSVSLRRQRIIPEESKGLKFY